MILVRGDVVGKDVSMNYKMGEPFGEALSFGVLRKMTRVSCMMRAWNCNSLPGKNLSHVAAYTVVNISSSLIPFDSLLNFGLRYYARCR